MSLLITGITPEELLRVFEWARIGANNCMIGRGVLCIELPEHGDLIERDELMKHGVYIPQDGGNLPVVYMSYVKAAKTVIPAERSEE